MKVLILVGATCSGKTEIAFYVAKKLSCEIIFADSMKVYKRMNIGTAKPSQEMLKEIKFHLLDIIDPYDRDGFNASKFVKLCFEKIDESSRNGNIPLIVCGTPMYLHLLLNGHFSGVGRNAKFREEMTNLISEKGVGFLYNQLKEIDPIYAEKISSNDAKRIIRALEVFHLTGEKISTLHQKNENRLSYPFIILGIRRSREDLYERINKRVNRMIENELVEEVKNLITSAQGKSLNPEAQQAIGYKQLIDYLNKKSDLQSAISEIKKKTRNLARRQLTWFKTFDVHWIEVEKNENLKVASEKFIDKFSEFLRE